MNRQLLASAVVIHATACLVAFVAVSPVLSSGVEAGSFENERSKRVRDFEEGSVSASTLAPQNFEQSFEQKLDLQNDQQTDQQTELEEWAHSLPVEVIEPVQPTVQGKRSFETPFAL